MATRRKRSPLPKDGETDPAAEFSRLSRAVVATATRGGKRGKRSAARVADLRDARALDRALDVAVKLGVKQADWVVKRRQAQRIERERKLAAAARVRGRKGARAKAATTAPGIVIAEGDSWFDYPFYDILKLLEDDFGFAVEHVAHRGDSVESMAYDGGQLDDLTRTLERVIGAGRRPRAILLSGGGNDIAGDGFAMLLNHRSSPMHGLNAAVLAGVIQTRIVVAYATIIAAVTEVAQRLLGTPLPILLHGYDHPVPDGRGFLGGFGWLPGPWLEPGFREKGYGDLAERTAIAEILIEHYYAALADLVARPGFAHVRLVDLRNLLSNELALDRYRAFWGNELHPTRAGFLIVAQAFADALAAL